jgi:hypothetical protein
MMAIMRRQTLIERLHISWRDCREGVFKTTQIGRKMISASKTSSSLQESYEKLGKMALKATAESKVEWNDPRAQDLMNYIKQCEIDLELLEQEMNRIRFSPSPIEIKKISEFNDRNDFF